MNRLISNGVVVAVMVTLFAACNSPRGADTAQATNSAKTDSSSKIIVVDVRTPEEYAGDGHADCTVNYPLDQFSQHIDELKSYDKVYLVCRSGGRAGAALEMLTEAGYTKGENAGSWQDAPCANK